MPQFPAAMPSPNLQGLEENPARQAILETSMSEGPAKRRPRTTAVIEPFRMDFAPVTPVARLAFLAFFRTELKYGTLEFEMEHPFEGTLRSWRFSARGPYSISQIGLKAFSISTNLELMP